ncbi:C-C motif chemokine 15 [Ictidomys tridecemlineatus]|uniref:C-C motif chemokine 15 n=1 Tax=Ictidomys tridecemlineatus TaxID=43179 RepID=UPI00038C5391|nr:C-C motif chemokine 15 [Ictidomys tridecemlineatus]KAG3269467.1 C-C motif chemokine ligand 15 [Ictidomys tridecemlineatus]
MKVSAVALSFLILGAALGSQAQVIPDPETRELLEREHTFQPPLVNKVFNSPADCCFSYITRSIRCTVMKTYHKTSSGCSQPAVIFITNKGQHVCANPNDPSVQECMKKLKHNPSS